MYLEHFGLEDMPFSIAPNPRYLYLTHQHQEALAHLTYGLGSAGGVILLTGEVGTGKTTISRKLLEDIPEHIDVAWIVNPKLSAEELLASVCDELGIGYETDHSSIKVFTDLINNYLISAHSRGRNVVLMIDEAQNLSPEVLEQLRLLTNLETSEHKLLQIILLGQPELKELLERNDLRQLSQRIAARFHLNPLNQDECNEYIRHRLAVAGCNRLIVSKKAIDYIFHAGHGTPRLINLLCDRALLGAYSCNEDMVTLKHAQQASREVLGAVVEQKKKHLLMPLMLVVLAMAGGILWLNGGIWRGDTVDSSQMTIEPTLSEQSEAERPEPKRSESKRAESKRAESKRPESKRPESKRPEPEQANGLQKGRELTTNISSPTAVIAHSDVGSDASVEVSPQTLWDVIEDAGSRLTAFNTLANVWQVNLTSGKIKPCDQLAEKQLECMQQRADVWLLRKHNRPALFQMTTAAGQQRYAVIRAFQNGQFVVQLEQHQWEISRAELEQHWQGQITLLWLKPPGYKAPVKKGDTGRMVTWLAQKMDVIQGEMIPPQTFTVMNEILIERIKYFQQLEGLNSDGIAGPLTLMRVNESTDPGKPRLTDKASPLRQYAKLVRQPAAPPQLEPKPVIAKKQPVSSTPLQYMAAPMMLKGKPWAVIEKTGTRFLAFATLADDWKRSIIDAEISACDQLAEQQLFCLRQSANIWLLREYNRPAVFQIKGADGQQYYAVIRAIRDDRFVIELGHQRWNISQAELEQHWQGEMTVLWVQPPGYEKDIQLGDSGRLVTWLAQKMDKIQGKKTPSHALSSMTAEFTARMKRFQAAEGLPADGIVGPLTLIRINEYLNQIMPRLNDGRLLVSTDEVFF